MQDALSQIHASLQRLEKKGRESNHLCQKRLVRLKSIVCLHQEKREALEQVRQMRAWVIEAEHILDGSWASCPEEISNAEVGKRLDECLKQLSCFLESEQRTEDERDRARPSTESDDTFEARSRPVL